MRDHAGMGADHVPAALVTGGGSGIGAAVARQLAAAGFGVAVAGRRREPLERVAAALGGVACTGDVGSPDDAERIVAEAVAALGGLDALVLAAGGGHAGSVLEQTPASFEAVVRTNLTGAFLTARAALPHLLERRGAIVAVGSLAGLRAGSRSAAYGPAKAGLAMLVQSIAVDYGPRGVRASCVCPGWTETAMADAAMDGLASELGIDRAGAYAVATVDVPLRRPATADEVAAAVIWLLSPAASYVNGVVLPLDGGASVVDICQRAFDPEPP
jgi:NAD(P)-dependent dehydrogenase (short-subunit alcohol dehydrogenase family)